MRKILYKRKSVNLKKGVKVKRAIIKKLVLLIPLCSFFINIKAPAPTSRSADRAEQLSPHNVIMSSLMFHMTELLSAIESCMVFQKKAAIEAQNTLESIAEQSQCSCEKLCELLNIASYESSYTGGLHIFNLGGPNHNNTDALGNPLSPAVNCWDNALTITDSDSRFDGVNVIKIQENITFKPSTTMCTGTENLAAIIVEKDNMTIDLSGFSIAMDGQNLMPNPPTTSCSTETGCATPNCVAQVHGIIIKKGVKNTKIISTTQQHNHTNGSIHGFTGFGIVIEGDTGIDETVKEVSIDNIQIYDCFSGIWGQNASNVNVTKTKTNNNCNYENVYGMKFDNVAHLYIMGSQASSNKSCKNVYGIQLNDVAHSLIQDTECSKNQSVATAVTTMTGSVYGVHMTASAPNKTFANKLKNCTVTANLCSETNSSECVGIQLDSNTAHNIIEECSVLANNFNATTSPPNAFGIKLDNSNYNELTKNKVGFNGNVTTAPTNANIGIYDTLQTTGSTSLFTSNISFFNGSMGTSNYSIKFKKNQTSPLEDFKATVIYAANLEGVATTTPTLGNLDIKKTQ